MRPNQAEACNRIDDNCNGMTDEGLATASYYPDCDGDAYGAASATPVIGCSAPTIAVRCTGAPASDASWVTNGGDCDDRFRLVHPGASTLCDCTASHTYDGDGDGHVLAVCGGDDCNDLDASAYPGAAELCDRIDRNCSSAGGVDSSEDSDGDGYAALAAACSGGFARTDCNDANAAVNPGASESRNGIDDNCDGRVDEPTAAIPSCNHRPLRLGTAGNFTILAETGISTGSTSAVTGNIGVSPAAATYITGFSLTADASNVFSTSPRVTGRVYASNYSPPTPSNLAAAVADMETAYTEATRRTPDVTGLGAGSVGGMTLVPGVYSWGGGLTIPTNVTLNGSPTDVWIFQVAGDFTMSSAARIVLAAGALARNVFWQVAGLVDLGMSAHCEGAVLTRMSITLRTSASVDGMLLAQTAVSIASGTVLRPAP